MFRVFLICFFFLQAISSPAIAGCDKIVHSRIPSEDHRYKTFCIALKLIKTRNLQMIVETGTYRDGERCLDGCSTLIFADWVKQHGGSLYSVDISPTAIQNATRGLGSLTQYVSFVEGDSIEFLKNFGQRIDFLYLDSFDFETANPDPSQQHHLKEIIAAYPWLTKTSIVMIDDCGLPHGGKGKLAIDYLLDRGWKILVKQYQVILSQ